MSFTRWTEQHGRDVIRRWRRSGQSIAAFAREHGIDPQRLRYWRERVEPQRAARTSRVEARRAKSGSAVSKFVPGLIVGVRAPVSVHLGRGVVVEIQSTGEIEPSWLAELARALEQAL